MNNAKKAQEEMVGFAILVILVAIAGVIFLAIMLNQKGTNEISSIHVQQFSDSLIQSTTECNIGAWPSLSDFSDVIDKCYNSPSQQCASGENVCDYLNETIQDITNSVWNINSDSAFNGAKYSISFKNRISDEESIIVSNNWGNCTYNTLGGESIIPDSEKKGNIIFRVQICLNK